MPRKKSDHLFQLIKSLNKNEKRYIRLFARQQAGKKKYLELLDIIDKQQVYDEKTLKVEWKSSNLAVAKSYLYNLILKSLINYHSEQTIKLQLKEFLKQCTILYQKRLYDQCLLLLNKAKQLARSYDEHLILLEIFEWEQEIMMTNVSVGELKKISDEVLQQELYLLKREQYDRLYKHRMTTLFVLDKEKLIHRKQQAIHAFDAIMQDRLFQDPPSDLSFKARFRLNGLLGAYHYIHKNWSEYYTSCQKNIDLLNNHPHQARYDPHRFISSLSNLMTAQKNLNHKTSFLKNLKILQQFPLKLPPNKRTHAIKIHTSTRAHYLALTFFVDNGYFEEALHQVHKTHSWLKQNKDSIDREFKIQFPFFFFYTYFGLEDYEKALFWLNKLLNEPQLEILRGLYNIAHVANLILHYELRHYDLLDYLARATYRKLLKSSELYKLESRILHFLRNTLPKIDLSDKTRLKKAFRELRNDLKTITEEPLEAIALEYFDFISWLDSKVENRPFAEVVREKSRQQPETGNSLGS